eukprot:GFUD01138143.1.p1 GENE.GFUD01138143.1~~GFUD01138143.1.p1  ORF type:complete len:452 (+),score=159.71 GFUD01138143.1:50-1405(+)
MGRLEMRLTELERKQGEIQLKLDRLDKEDQGEERKRKDLGRERKVLLRELVDVKIRIRNLQRNRKKQIIVLGTSTCEETRPRDVDEIDDADAQSIDDLCDNFNPEALKLNTTRPEIRVYPKVPLPHSQPNWDKVIRVGRRRERPMVRWTDWEGQFTGVEEEEERSWQVSGGGRNWIRQDRHFSSRDEFGRWRDAGKDFCAPDDLARFEELNPPDQKSHSSHFKVPVTNTVAENLGTELSSPPKAVSSTYPVQSLHLNCICYRPLHLVTCSSPSCGHSFYGRVATLCPTHPTDHYLMDHPTICPHCKAVPLVEDMKATSSSGHKKHFTTIKSKPVDSKAVPKTGKSPTANQAISCVEEKGRQPQSGCGKKDTKLGQEEVDVERAASNPVNSKLTTVKTKLVKTSRDAAPPLPSPVVTMATVLPCGEQVAQRERLRKRLILSKSGEGRGEMRM